MDEQLLIDGCKRGEASARKELYELYAPAMMSVCARYVHDRETARDLLQDGFIKVFTKIQTYSATGPFGAWLRRVFVTTALEYLRKYDALRSRVESTSKCNYSHKNEIHPKIVIIKRKINKDLQTLK